MKTGRKLRKFQRKTDAIATKAVNGALKSKERSRRDTRMFIKLKAGSLPYTPTVMSWLSRKLDKPSNKITSKEIKTLLG